MAEIIFSSLNPPNTLHGNLKIKEAGLLNFDFQGVKIVFSVDPAKFKKMTSCIQRTNSCQNKCVCHDGGSCGAWWCQEQLTRSCVGTSGAPATPVPQKASGQPCPSAIGLLHPNELGCMSCLHCWNKRPLLPGLLITNTQHGTFLKTQNFGVRRSLRGMLSMKQMKIRPKRIWTGTRPQASWLPYSLSLLSILSLLPSFQKHKILNVFCPGIMESFFQSILINHLLSASGLSWPQI